jgi:hypothetical protein
MKTSAFLKNIEEGMIKHSSNSDLGASIDLAGVTEKLNNIILKRQQFKDSRNNTRILAVEYKNEFDSVTKFLAGVERILRAKLGINDPRLVDFGMEPYKKRTATPRIKKPTNPGPVNS